MITSADYFAAYENHDGITTAMRDNAVVLLGRVNCLLEECEALGWNPRINPATGTMISGQKNGGWRPQDCPVGTPNSSHKQGEGVDVADGDGELDTMIDDAMLIRHGLFREHPEATP